MLVPPSRISRPDSSAPQGLPLGRRLLRAVDALSARLGTAPPLPPHLAAGLRGEEEAFFYLRRHGYVVVARRWRTPGIPGDADLVAWHGGTLCFIEVKTRSRRDIVPAEFAVDARKQKLLRAMADVFRKRLPEATRSRTPLRFDVVSVYLPASGTGALPEIELFPAAFDRHGT